MVSDACPTIAAMLAHRGLIDEVKWAELASGTCLNTVLIMGAVSKALEAYVIYCRKGGLQSRCEQHGREVFAEIGEAGMLSTSFLDIRSPDAGASGGLSRLLMCAGLLGVWALRLMRISQRWENTWLL